MPCAHCLMKKLKATKTTPHAIPDQPSMLNTWTDVIRAAFGSSTCPPTVSVPARPAIHPPTYWAAAEDRNQTAIMKETTEGSESLVISDRHTGDRNSAPVGCRG